jgi:hypothetical protein
MGEQAVANHALAQYCRGCGRRLAAAQEDVPRALLDTAWQAELQRSDWLELPAPFDLQHRRLVRAKAVAGASYFVLPSGELISRARGLSTTAARVRLDRFFPREAFERREALHHAPLMATEWVSGSIRRPLAIATTATSLFALLPEQPSPPLPLFDLGRSLGPGWQVVGGAVVLGSKVLLAARKSGDTALVLLAGSLSGGSHGVPEFELVATSPLALGRRQYLGPIAVWDNRAALITNGELVLFDLEGRAIRTEVHRFVGAGGIAQFALEGELLTPRLVMTPGNPCFTGERLLMFVANGSSNAILELVRRDSGFVLRRIERDLAENDVAFTGCEVAGRPLLLGVWSRRIHANNLIGGRRTFDAGDDHDQHGEIVQRNGMVWVRRVQLDGFACYALATNDGLAEPRVLGRVSLGGVLAISPPLLDVGGVQVLVLDPVDQRRVAVLRIACKQPEQLVEAS